MGYLNDVHSSCGFSRAWLPRLILVPAWPRWGTRPASCDQVQLTMFSGQGVCPALSLCDLHNQTFSTACGDEACAVCLSQPVQLRVPSGRTSLNLLPAYSCQSAFPTCGGPRPPTCLSCIPQLQPCVPRVSVTAAQASCPCLCPGSDSPSTTIAAYPDHLPAPVHRCLNYSGLRCTKFCRLRRLVALAPLVQPSPATPLEPPSVRQCCPGSAGTVALNAPAPRFPENRCLRCATTPETVPCSRLGSHRNTCTPP